MDWVGVEPTTSAHSILRQSAIDGKLVQIPPAPPFLCKSTNIDHQARFEKASQGSSKNKTTMAGFGISCLSKREIETSITSNNIMRSVRWYTKS
jgi:hypothetical protein